MPGLPWAVPVPPPVLGLPLAVDEPDDSDPEPSEPLDPVGAVAPPVDEDFAGGLGFLVGVVGPVGEGTPTSYWTPLDSSAA